MINTNKNTFLLTCRENAVRNYCFPRLNDLMLQKPPQGTIKSCKLNTIILSHTFQGHRDRKWLRNKMFQFLQFHLTSSQTFSHIFTRIFGWKQVLLFGKDSTYGPVKWSHGHILDVTPTCSLYSDTQLFFTCCTAHHFKYFRPLNAATILCCSLNQFPWFPVHFLKFILIASANSFVVFFIFYR